MWHPSGRGREGESALPGSFVGTASQTDHCGPRAFSWDRRFWNAMDLGPSVVTQPASLGQGLSLLLRMKTRAVRARETFVMWRGPYPSNGGVRPAEVRHARSGRAWGSSCSRRRIGRVSSRRMTWMPDSSPSAGPTPLAACIQTARRPTDLSASARVPPTPIAAPIARSSDPAQRSRIRPPST